jgi:hypothetical protein
MSTNVARLPKQIQRQVAHSKDVEEHLQRIARGETPPETAPPAPREGEPAPAPAPEPAPPAAAAPPAAPPPAAAPPAAEPPQQAQPPGDWQQRYEALRGKYDAEVPQLTQQLRVLEARLADVTSLLANMRQQPAPQAAPPAGPPLPAPTAKVYQQVLDRAAIEDYGVDMVEMIERLATAVVDRRLAAVKVDLGKAKSTAEAAQQTAAQTAQQRMFQELDQAMPEWRQIDKSAEFLQWLEGVDPYSGYKRVQLIQSAAQANDAQRVLVFFRGFKNEQAATSQAQVPPNAPPAPPVPPKPSLDTFAAPPTTGGAPPVTPPQSQAQFFKQSDVSAFYAAVRAGRFRGNPAEQQRIEQEIVKAAAEGRVVDG